MHSLSDMSLVAIRERHEGWRRFLEKDEDRVAADLWRDIGALLAIIDPPKPSRPPMEPIFNLDENGAGTISFPPPQNITFNTWEKEIIRINLETGKVTLFDTPDEAAKLFWDAVTKLVNTRCHKCEQEKRGVQA